MVVAAELADTIAKHWWVLLIRGILGIIFGVLFIFYPGNTLVAFVYLFGAYALIDGAFALIQAFRLGIHSDRWWPLLLEGVLGIAVGIVFFRYTGIGALAIAFVIAVWAVATGILELVAAFRFGGSGGAPWLLGIAGVLSIIVGVLFAIVPLPALLAYVLVLGIYAIVFGLIMIVWSFRLRSASAALTPTPAAT